MSNFTNRINQLSNLGGTTYTGANVLGGVDKMLDDRNPDAGIGAGAIDLSNAAASSIGTPWMLNRMGGRTRGALGLLSLPGTVSGAAQGLTSGDMLGTAGGALDGYLAYRGGKEFIKSPLGQRSVAFLNDTAKPAVVNAARQVPGAVAGAATSIKNTYNAAKPAVNMAYDAAKPVVANAVKNIPVGAASKFIGKKVPLVGLGIGLGAAGDRAMAGDFEGAAGELASGAASTFPGPGTALSAGIDAGLMARDADRARFGANMPNSTNTAGAMSAGGTLSGTSLPQGTFKMEAMPKVDQVATNSSLSYPSPKITIGNPTELRPQTSASTPTTPQPVQANPQPVPIQEKPQNFTPITSATTPKPVAMDIKPEQIKLSAFRRNTGIVEGNSVWVNPADREEVEKLGFSWEAYTNLPPEDMQSSPKDFFSRLK
jgi:hypothetical protein